MAELPLCPRCGHYLPNDSEPGVGPGLPTMAPAPGELRPWICEPCGWHEAWQQAQGEISAIDGWPVIVPERFYRGVGSC